MLETFFNNVFLERDLNNYITFISENVEILNKKEIIKGFKIILEKVQINLYSNIFYIDENFDECLDEYYTKYPIKQSLLFYQSKDDYFYE